MTGVDELIAFVRQQLDDDERVARGASGAPWVALTIYPDRGEVVVRPNGDGIARTPDHGLAEHIARWDPARVLAEVEAKRRILDEHPHEPASPWGTTAVTSIGCATCHDHGEGVIGKGWCQTVRLLAQPYAGRDGWREEWADVR